MPIRKVFGMFINVEAKLLGIFSDNRKLSFYQASLSAKFSTYNFVLLVSGRTLHGPASGSVHFNLFSPPPLNISCAEHRTQLHYALTSGLAPRRADTGSSIDQAIPATKQLANDCKLQTHIPLNIN